RNTDNAWVETDAYMFHITDPARARAMVVRGTDDAEKAKWTPIDEIDLTPEDNPIHQRFVDIAKAKMKDEVPRDNDKMRIAVAQVNTRCGDFKGNKRKILNYINQAKLKEADMVVFPELTITGYPPEDLIFKKSFIRRNYEILEQLAREIKGINVQVGFIDVDDRGRAYNAVAIIEGSRQDALGNVTKGGIKGIYRKKELPNYAVFDEKRYFHSGGESEVYDLGGVPFSSNICEDVWIGEKSVYVDQADKGARVLLNSSASPFYAGKQDVREELLKKRARQTDCFIAYANLAGAQDEVVFDGGSFIVDPQGNVIARARGFGEELIMADIDVGDYRKVGPKPKEPVPVHRFKAPRKKAPLPEPVMREKLDRMESLRQAIITGIRDYVKKNKMDKVALGLSGGIDSAIVAALAVEALGADKVVAISMPTRYNKESTKADARKIAAKLGIEFYERPIEDIFNLHLEEIAQDPMFKGLPVDEDNAADENLQPRIRMTKLMYACNRLNYLLLTTGNKSELAVGYATIYGDMAGGFAPIMDMFKTDVFKLAKHINRTKGDEIIPESTIGAAPSAELKENHYDSDKLPPYELLDQILEAYIERDESVAEMSQKWDPETVYRVVRMVEWNQFKRKQYPIGVKLTERSFGKDRRMPITNAFDDNPHKIDLWKTKAMLRKLKGAREKDEGTAGSDPVLKLFAAPYPGDKEEGAGDTGKIFESLAALHKTPIELFIPESYGLSEGKLTAMKGIGKWLDPSKEFVRIRKYSDAGHLKRLLGADGVTGDKRMIITDAKNRPGLCELFIDDIGVFKDTRLISVDIDELATPSEKNIHRVRGITLALLARLIDGDKTPSVEAVFKNILKFHMEESDVDLYLRSLKQDGDPEKAIGFFLKNVIKFSKIIAEEYNIMRTFWTYA
ncbi:MAG: NAD+ synthase, partial [Candidatus Omnitrophica bacterium]|nr:NAD+ synthase [Candidatus Omnitrophota bacterium]